MSSGWGWKGTTLRGDGGGGYPSAYAHCSGALGDPAVQWWLDAVGLHVSKWGDAVVRPTYTAGGADLRICVCVLGGR